MEREQAEVVVECFSLHRFPGSEENRVHVLADVSHTLHAAARAIAGRAQVTEESHAAYRGRAFNVFPLHAEGFAAALRRLLSDRDFRLALARDADDPPRRDWHDYGNEFKTFLAAA